MSPTIKVPCRVDYRPVSAATFCEQTSRLDPFLPQGARFGLANLLNQARWSCGFTYRRGDWPLRVDHANVTWGHWGGFTVEFISMPAEEEQRLQNYLATTVTPANSSLMGCTTTN